jgi:hypothetical protein
MEGMIDKNFIPSTFSSDSFKTVVVYKKVWSFLIDISFF